VPRFNHGFSFPFEIVSRDKFGHDITSAQLREAIMARLDSLSDDELADACDEPLDTYEEAGGPDAVAVPD